MLSDQAVVARTATSGYLQAKATNIVSNLNPYAKEFYPSYMKSWRLKEDPDTRIVRPQLKTYTIIEAPQEDKVRVFNTKQELIDVKYNYTMHQEVYETRMLDTKIEIKSPTIAKPDVQKNIPTTVNHMEKIRKPYTIGCKAKPTSLTAPIKSGTVPQRNSSTLKLSSAKPPPTPTTGPVSKTISTSTIASKSKLVSKFANSKLTLDANKREIPTKSPNKDCLSIKSGTSSEKSTLSIKDNSSSNKLAVTAEKSHVTRTSLQNNLTSKASEKSVTRSKPKQIAIKSPRGTVASTLRKTETQKRRNMFPYDPVLNIEMSEFLFK